MGIELATVTTNKTASSGSSSSSSTSNVSSKDSSASFKEQLKATKTKENSEAKAKEAEISDAKENETLKVQENTDAKALQDAQKAKSDDASKIKLAEDNKKSKDAEEENPVKALSAKITTIRQLKEQTNMVSKVETSNTKTQDLKSEDYCKVLKMDNNDIKFFTNLVQNQDMTAQNAQAAGLAQSMADNGSNFTEIKTSATQQSVQVSQTLLDALNESSKTGKSVRIDFDKDIAVVMKLDRNGTISANFIPGDAAVENYLRNNIAGLRQNFEDKNLAYNELTYSKQKQNQQGKQQRNKENEDE